MSPAERIKIKALIMRLRKLANYLESLLNKVGG